MATVANNHLIDGLSGRLGASLVFRTLRGKTFVTTPARKPDKRKETAAQKSTRVTFRQAAEWAQHILLDPEKKMYYQKKAKKLKLPNAYTAALTDYMRKPQLTVLVNKDRSIRCKVNKKDFQLKKVEVIVKKSTGDEVRLIAPRDTDWIFLLAKEEAAYTYIKVTDAVDKVYRLETDYN